MKSEEEVREILKELESSRYNKVNIATCDPFEKDVVGYFKGFMRALKLVIEGKESDKQMNKIYLVVADNGLSYEDNETWVDGVFDSEEKAIDYLKKNIKELKRDHDINADYNIELWVMNTGLYE